MNKTSLLLILPTLLAGCLEPNLLATGEGDASSDTGTSDPAADASTTGSDPDPDDDADATDGGDSPDPDDGESSGSGDGSESGTVMPDPECDLTTHACVSNVPDGWNGPVARIDGDNVVGCQGAYDVAAVQTYEQLFAADAVCTCNCGNPTGGECEQDLDFELYPIVPYGGACCVNQFGCDMMYDGEVQTVETGQIWTYPNGTNAYDARIIAHPVALVEAGDCAPLHTETIAESQLAGVVQACEPSAAVGSCDAETICVPKVAAPFEAGVCIWAEGDQACPAGTDFFQREVRNSGVVDTRACSECTCGGAVGEECDESTVSVWRALEEPVTFPVDGTCDTAYLGDSAYFTAVTYDANDPSGGSCDPSGGVPGGSVEAEMQITFCCT